MICHGFVTVPLFCATRQRVALLDGLSFWGHRARGLSAAEWDWSPLDGAARGHEFIKDVAVGAPHVVELQVAEVPAYEGHRAGGTIGGLQVGLFGPAKLGQEGAPQVGTLMPARATRGTRSRAESRGNPGGRTENRACRHSAGHCGPLRKGLRASNRSWSDNGRRPWTRRSPSRRGSIRITRTLWLPGRSLSPHPRQRWSVGTPFKAQRRPPLILARKRSTPESFRANSRAKSAHSAANWRCGF